MQHPQTFSQCLKTLMKEHNLFINNLGLQLGCKAVLRKVLDEGASTPNLNLLFDLLCSNKIFAPHELVELEKALSVSKLGIKRYLSISAIDKVLNGETSTSHTHIQLAGGKTLAQRLRIFQGAQKLRILCVNTCYRSLFNDLSALLGTFPEDTKIRHYVHLSMPGCDAACLVYCVMPILFDHRYLPYGILGEAEKASALTAQYISGNYLAIQAVKNGRHIESFFVMKDSDNGFEFTGTSHSGLYDFLFQLTSAISPKPNLLRVLESTTADYATLLTTALKRELGRATYFWGYGLCYQMIPTSIMRKAFLEKAMFSPELTTSWVEHIEPLFEQRHQNFFHKKKDNYVIFTLSGCRDFLETGHTSDHYIGFRDYTPAERLEIMSIFLQNAVSNPYFHPYVLKESVFPKCVVVCYDERSLTLVNAQFNHDLQSCNSTDIYLDFPEFSKQFIDYYFNCLIKEKCLSQEESLSALNALNDEYTQKFSCADTF